MIFHRQRQREPNKEGAKVSRYLHNMLRERSRENPLTGFSSLCFLLLKNLNRFLVLSQPFIARVKNSFEFYPFCVDWFLTLRIFLKGKIIISSYRAAELFNIFVEKIVFPSFFIIWNRFFFFFTKRKTGGKEETKETSQIEIAEVFVIFCLSWIAFKCNSYRNCCSLSRFFF